ncbi:maleylacetate reductase [Arthrobacter sulfonylureivorans]|uniref:maleylacetate reductase n=1 Tax=Arthrobacter sulfonylureivorans TaxID=2486855 RepID=UPI0039E2DBD7
MPLNFEHITLGQRVVFESGRFAQNVAAEGQRLGAQRVMLIASNRDHELVSTLSAAIPVALRWNEVRQHVPVENAERARAAAAEAEVDLLVAVGGGSATGLAKAIALTSSVPIVSVPTTFSGSEATNMWGLTENGTKRTGIDLKVLPAAVVYDAELTLPLPLELAVSSGLNGLAHAVDSLWAPRADPINQALALEGARSLAGALRGLVAHPDDLSAREQALYGCYLSAVAFASAGSGLHHKICHVLGGTFDLPHAPTHAAVLPYVLALNAPAVPELAARLAGSLGTQDPGEDPAAAAVAALSGLHTMLGAPGQLRGDKFTTRDIAEATSRIVAAAPSSNPVAVTEENITMLLSDALTGAVPTSPFQWAQNPTREQGAP